MSVEGLPDGYVRQVQLMCQQFAEWRSTHGHIPIIIEFKVPNRMWVATDIVTALKEGILVADAAGKRMLQELGWLDDVKTMPSLMMVKMAIEHVNTAHPKDPPPSSATT